MARLVAGSPVDVVGRGGQWSDPARRRGAPAPGGPGRVRRAGRPGVAAGLVARRRRPRRARSPGCWTARPGCRSRWSRGRCWPRRRGCSWSGRRSRCATCSSPAGGRGRRCWPTGGSPGSTGRCSTAVGAALAHGAVTYALMGDLTFLHDANGLVLGPDEPRPDLVLVVVNNDGGAIFGLLEQAGPEHAAAFERVFGTPHGVDLGAAVRRDADPVRAGLDGRRPARGAGAARRGAGGGGAHRPRAGRSAGPGAARGGGGGGGLPLLGRDALAAGAAARTWSRLNRPAPTAASSRLVTPRASTSSQPPSDTKMPRPACTNR